MHGDCPAHCPSTQTAKRVILFGSRARGDAHARKAILDLLVVAEDAAASRSRGPSALYGVLSDIPDPDGYSCLPAF